MPSSSLAIIVGPALMRPKIEKKDTEMLHNYVLHPENIKLSIKLMENFILNHDTLMAPLIEDIALQTPPFSPPTSARSQGTPRNFKNSHRKNEKIKDQKAKKLPADDPERIIVADDAECINSLQAILQDEKMKESFMKYLREKEYSDENMLFYYAVDTYKQTSFVQQKIALIREIVMLYICEKANYQINIDSELRQNIQREAKVFEQEGVDVALLQYLAEAQEFIFRLVNDHSYPRFLQSLQCRLTLKTLEESDSKIRKK